jgi:diguanylate cyclase (GGDEF)-like protein
MQGLAVQDADMSPIDLTKFEQLKASGRLPSPKGVALAILRLTQKEDASMAELARIIKSDPAFVGRLIKAANSVNANPGRPVVSVQEALVVLGMPAVRNLALGLSLLSQYRKGTCQSFEYERFWSASLACGIALQALTQCQRVAQPEEAFSVGLLARIGELALATLYSDEYARILRAASKLRPGELARMEGDAFAMTHCELSAAMLTDWGLPKIFVESVRRHEDVAGPGSEEHDRDRMLVRMLALAREIAELCLAPADERPQHMARLLALGESAAIGADEIGPLCDRVVREWREWAGMLQVVSQPLPPFDEMARAQAAPVASVARRAPAGPAPDRLRVLVVDSDASARQALRAVLEAADCAVAEAADGEAGLQAALQDEPQMMLAARTLPRMDGLALVRALRETRPGRAMYLFVLNASGDEQQVVEALEAGADDALAKPPNPQLLRARLQAGRRVLSMQQEIERDREELRRFAAELSVANRRLQEVALTDVLTGLPNRRYAMERLQQEWAASSRSLRPQACMVIDLDEFKQVNDIYGHDIGDAFLTQSAAAIRGALRAQDVLCRIGGDEFLVICPDTDLQAAMACAERVRRAVETRPIASGQLRLKGSISVGVAERQHGTPDAEALIRQADQGVCLAKRHGRNRVVTTQSPAAHASA